MDLKRVKNLWIVLILILSGGLVAAFSSLVNQYYLILMRVIIAFAIYLFSRAAQTFTENRTIRHLGTIYFLSGVILSTGLLAASSRLQVMHFPISIVQANHAVAIFESIAILTVLLLRLHNVKLVAMLFTLECIISLAGQLLFSTVLSSFAFRFVAYQVSVTAAAGLYLFSICILRSNRDIVEYQESKLLQGSFILNAISLLLMNYSVVNQLSEIIVSYLGVVSWVVLFQAIRMSGQFERYASLCNELSLIKRSESEARYRIEQHSALLDKVYKKISEVLSEQDFNRLTEKILTDMLQLLNASGGELGMYDQKRNEISVVCSINSGSEKGTIISSGVGVLGSIIENKRPVVIRKQDVDYHHHVGCDLGRTILAVPLSCGATLVGAVMIHRSTTEETFTDTEYDILNLLSQHAAIALRNAKLLEDARKMAETDSLTNLSNHRNFFEQANIEFVRALRYHHSLTALMFDIDHFKEVNDTYGHALGDQVLVSIATLCRQIFRSIDIIGRYGGEEFAVLLPETSLSTAKDVAERLRRAISSMVVSHNDYHISITISIGIASLRTGCTSVNALIEQADEALYSAKNSGRNKIAVWNEHMHSTFVRKQRKAAVYQNRISNKIKTHRRGKAKNNIL